MAVEKDFKLNERLFTFSTIPAFEAIDVEVNVAKVIGEPLFAAFTAPEGKDADALGAIAIGQLLSNMDAKVLKETITTVFKYVRCDGKEIVIDMHFTGRNKELWIVLIQALRFNFSDFLPDSLLTSLKGKIKTI
jgi:hypothetical protein